MPGPSRTTSNTTAANGFLPDLDAVPVEVLGALPAAVPVQPGEPRGHRDEHGLPGTARCELAEQHDFVIASDECYADLFDDESSPPPSLLGAAAAMGNTGFSRCMTFHSLSKRSSLPGLRSGFVAGDAALIKPVPAVPHLPRLRHADTDPARQRRGLERRRACRRQPRAVPAQVRSRAADPAPVIAVRRPEGGFYLWLDVGGDDEAFTAGLFADTECHRRARQLSRPPDAAGQSRRGLRAHLARCFRRRMRAGCRAAFAISSFHGTLPSHERLPAPDHRSRLRKACRHHALRPSTRSLRQADGRLHRRCSTPAAPASPKSTATAGR